MTQECDLDTECTPYAEHSGNGSFIRQAVNESLFIAEKDNDKNTKEQHHFSSFSSFNNSEVEHTFTFDCFLNDFSSDQIAQFSDNAKAKYGSSFVSSPCGEILLASERNLAYFSSENFSTNQLSNLNKYENSNSDMPENFIILSLLDNNSSKTNSGEKNFVSFFNNSLITCLLVESDLKNEKRILASGINDSGSNSIFNYRPCLLATRFFKSSDSCFACSSVNLELDSILSANENLRSITKFFIALDRANSKSSFSSGGTSSLIVNSSINVTNEIVILELYKASDRYVHLQSKRIGKDIDIVKSPMKNNPFASFTGYNEKISKQSMTNNDYAIAVSIIIKKNLNEIGENIDEVVPHEYAHTKIFEDLGDKWPDSLVTPNKVKDPRRATLEFEEFLANDLAKSKIPEFSIQKLDFIVDVGTAKKILDGVDNK